MPSKEHKVVLELRGLKIGPLRKLVDFLYTSEMEVSREEAQDVLAAARQLQVSELESLQLEGGKLVKKALGQRLNRKCLQVSSPVSIPKRSPPDSGVCCLTSHLLVQKQQAGVQLPCNKVTGNNSHTCQKETVKEEPSIKSEDKHQLPAKASAMAEFLTAKVKKRLAGTVKNVTGNEETGNRHAEQARPRVKQAVAGLQGSKKIKLSCPEPSSSPSPTPCTTKDHSVIVSNKISESIRRLWCKEGPPAKDGAKGPEALHDLHGSSPSVLPKATKGRRRGSSDPAPSVKPPQEAGQVGRVKLRKVINGSCWEVVQEPSAARYARTAGSACALTGKGSLPQPRYIKQEAGATPQQASLTRLLPAKAESSSLTEKTLVGEAGSVVALADGDSYQKLMLDQLAKGEQYDNLASARELEHMLDLLLPDAAAADGESQDAPKPKVSIVPLGNTGAEKKHWRSAEVPVCPQVKEEKTPLQEEEWYTAPQISKGTPGLTNGVPFLDPVHSRLLLATSQSSNDCAPSCGLTTPKQESWTAHRQLPVLEKGATRLTATSGAETKPQAQALLRSPLWRHLDCKPPPQLVILDEDEIDVGGVEEFFLNIECVRPDSSPLSENEVDVLN